MKPSSEGFRRVRKPKTKPSESFRKKEALSERTPEHTLTVREAQEICKKSGIGVTERTIINWCHPNDKGFTRLDAWKDIVMNRLNAANSISD